MSWSTQRSGRPAQVAEDVVRDAAQAAQYVAQHSPDEAAVLHAAVAAAVAACKACHPDATVSVAMCGSEFSHHPDGLPPLRAQSLSLTFSAQLPTD
jgi:methionine synthase II (cobalamin-independent)